MPNDPSGARIAAENAVRELLRALALIPGPPVELRVADAEAGVACLLVVWDAARAMPVAGAERRRRSGGGRAGCREDVVEAIRAAGKPLTRKQVVRAVRSAGKGHGPGTVAKALADLTAAGGLVNPRDKKGYRLPDWPRRSRTPSLFDAFC